jgi:FkbM family methyltransferase
MEDLLQKIHKKIENNCFIDGSIKDEFMEQVMSCIAITEYYRPNDRILEIGCNIGRNTLILSYLVGSENLVSIDAGHEYVSTCLRNLQNNGFLNSTVLPIALSNVPLKRHIWSTYERDLSLPLENDFNAVDTLTWTDFKKQYGMFQILVADCEGALFQILRENDDFLDTIHTIVVENDYNRVNEKEAVDAIYVRKGFVRVFDRPLEEERTHHVNAAHFYSIWTKQNN